MNDKFKTLSTRSRNSLYVMGITTIEQLENTPTYRFRKIPGFGRERIHEVCNLIGRPFDGNIEALDSEWCGSNEYIDILVGSKIRRAIFLLERNGYSEPICLTEKGREALAKS